MERLWLSGELRAIRGEQRLDASLNRRQARLLLAFLVLHRRRPSSRDELVEAVWPDGSVVEHAPALRVLLTALRRALGPDAIAGRTCVQLVLSEGAWVDVEAAEDAVRRARDVGPAAAWGLARTAAEALRDPLLAGETAPWLEDARRYYDALRLDALGVAAESALAAGRPRDGEAAARELVARAPLREDGYRLLMGALAAGGNAGAALVVYEDLRRLLRDELGTTPSSAAVALQARLLRVDAQAQAQPRPVGPAPTPPPRVVASRRPRTRGCAISRRAG